MKNIVITLYCIITVILASASFIEASLGRDFIHYICYNASWFFALWFVLGLWGCIYLFVRKLWKRPATLLLHTAFILILIGASITWLWGEKGIIHMREGTTYDTFYETQNEQIQKFPFSIRLNTFEITYNQPNQAPIDYKAHVSIIKEHGGITEHWISMNNILSFQGYRFYQTSFDNDGKGTWLSINHDPIGIGVTYTGYLLLIISMLYILISSKCNFRKLLKMDKELQNEEHMSNWLTRNKFWIIILFILLFQFIFWYSWLGLGKPEKNELEPILRTPLLGLHVSLIITAYALFLLTFINSVLTFIINKEFTKQKLSYLNKIVLYPATFLLAIGIFIGAMWANISWGSYWSWDPKETWALITLLVYAGTFHTESVQKFNKPRFFHTYIIIAFFMVLMTYFGVSYLGGLHTY